MSERSVITLKDLAHTLKRKKEIGAPPTLFLGSRTGWFYGHEKLYKDIRFSSKEPTAFEQLSHAKKFQECYKVLKGERFSTGTIDDLLKDHLGHHLEPRHEDLCLAEMIYDGYFDVVISTTIDPFLQEGLNHQRALQGMVPFGSKVKTLLLPFSPITDIIRDERQIIKVVKIFGDLATAREYYTAQHELNLDDKSNEELKTYLGKILARPTIVVGFDPIWDRPVEKVFLKSNDDIFFVNEDIPEEDSSIMQVIKARPGRCLLGDQGHYTIFMAALHKEIFSGEPMSFALARKLLAHMDILQKNIQKLADNQAEQTEAISRNLHMLNKGIENMQTGLLSLQETVQRLPETSRLEREKSEQS